jgi:hypothetical protein
VSLIRVHLCIYSDFFADSFHASFEIILSARHVVNLHRREVSTALIDIQEYYPVREHTFNV